MSLIATSKIRKKRKRKEKKEREVKVVAGRIEELENEDKEGIITLKWWWNDGYGSCWNESCGPEWCYMDENNLKTPNYWNQ